MILVFIFYHNHLTIGQNCNPYTTRVIVRFVESVRFTTTAWLACPPCFSLWQGEFSGRNYEHCRQWVVDRLKELAEVFAIKICAYTVMSNHYPAYPAQRGCIPANIPSILERLKIDPDEWLNTMCWNNRFRRAVGKLAVLKAYAEKIGRYWVQGAGSSQSLYLQ